MTEEAPTLPAPESASQTATPPDEVPPEGSLEERLRAALGADYELGPQIGRGGMGIVFRATDLRLKREVAIKVLPPEVTYRSDLRKRFVREAQVAASLTHPNIVPIYDVGNQGGLVWFVMALVNGESVRDLVRRSGPQPLHVALKVLQEAAFALSYAHARGVVHRDIKPDNIMIERATGRTIVTDFGLAKMRAEEGGTALTSAGGIVGTPAYMSPEQARGEEEVDQRTDIYSLGLVGYFILAGRNPFEGKGQQAVLARVLTEDAPNVANVRPDLPAWLVDVMGKATSRDPAKRYEKAEQLAGDLDQGENPKPVPTSVENLLDLLESYVELSILGAWMLLIFGVPTLPTGGWVIFVSLLCFPLMRAIQLVSVEGLQWPDVRNGIVARRIHWLRMISLHRQAGTSWIPAFIVALAVFGVVAVWFFEHYNFVSREVQGVYVPAFEPVGDNEARERMIKFINETEAVIKSEQSWNQDELTERTNLLNSLRDIAEEKYGTIEIRERPDWAFWYAILGSLIWARVFGLPRARRLNPWQLDAVTSWRLPKALDWLGALLFKPIGTVSRRIEATADFRQLADPAIQTALAFNRTRRTLGWGASLRMRSVIKHGKLLVRRLWYTHEHMNKLKAKAKGLGPEHRGAENLERQIARRENTIAECSAALDGLRSLLEEANSSLANGKPRASGADHRALEEARRLTRLQRIVSKSQWAYVLLFCGWLLLNAAVGITSKGGVVNFNPPQLGAAGVVVDAFFNVTLPLFILFQFFKRRLYS